MTLVMELSTAIFWARCALEDAMTCDDNGSFHRLRFSQAYYELRRFNRREQRRAKKAAKNLAMYKTAGRRPWSDGYQSDRLGDGCEWYSTRCTEARMAHLREPSGFVAMSRLADGLRKSGAIKSVQQLSDEIWSGII